MPGRPLWESMSSIRAQVDRLVIVVNGSADAVDRNALRLADELIVNGENLGAEQKTVAQLGATPGYYLTVDDDLRYPEDYVARHVKALETYGRDHITAIHGRRYEGHIRDWRRHRGSWPFNAHLQLPLWVNHVGTGTTCWHTDLKVPALWPVRNALDPQLAVWGQRNAVPMVLLPRKKGWISPILGPTPDSVYMTDKANGFATRDAVLHTWEEPWRVHPPK